MTPPPDPKSNRYDALAAALRVAAVLAATLALAALVLPGVASDAVGTALVVLLIVAPLLRVGWFVQRWFRRGDPRFGLVGVALLTVVAVGALLA